MIGTNSSSAIEGEAAVPPRALVDDQNVEAPVCQMHNKRKSLWLCPARLLRARHQECQRRR
jgi:hypothetical protein